MSKKRPIIKDNEREGPIWVVFFLAVFVGLLFLLRMNMLAFLLLLAMLLIAGMLIWLVKWQIDKKRQKRYEMSTEGMIKKHLQTCSNEIHRMHKELKDIQLNIKELQTKLAKTPQASTHARQETESLINAFQEEQKLRETKINFYKHCREKLMTLQKNQELVNTLGAKKEKLKSLRENHYEDIANMEALRSRLVHDQQYIETIETLSLRMLESTEVETAQELQLELKQLTEEVRRL